MQTIFDGITGHARSDVRQPTVDPVLRPPSHGARSRRWAISPSSSAKKVARAGSLRRAMRIRPHNSRAPRYRPDAMTEARIRLAFSPDSDDIFMFWALLAGKIDATGLAFEAVRADTETLNALAGRGDIDVCAASVARWPTIADRCLLLHHGMADCLCHRTLVVA